MNLLCETPRNLSVLCGKVDAQQLNRKDRGECAEGLGSILFIEHKLTAFIAQGF